MSEPQNLQNRVAMAFKEPTGPVEEPLDSLYLRIEHPSVALPHSLEPDPIDLFSPDETPERHGMLRYWLAGGGLVASALALSVGTDSGFMLLALCLGAIGVAAILYTFAARLEDRGDAAGERIEQVATRPVAPVVVAQGSYAGAGAMLGTIHDALGDITLCRSLKGEILSSNATFRALSACDKPEGRTCEELGIRFSPGKAEHCYDVEFRTANGPRIFLWHDVVTRDPLLEDLVIQSIARDVTSERDEIASRDHARSAAEQESFLKSRLIATVSHEIRTPLSGLLGMGHLLAGTPLSPEQKNYLDGISQSGTALVQLVEDLLDFSTLAAGRFQLKPRREAIRPLIEGVIELLSSRAHAKGIEIGAIVSPGLPETLMVDPARLRQVLYNVIGNAVKFTDTGGVLVSASLDGSALVIRVRDSGPGMDESEALRIFGEFEQGELTNAHDSGVGLGLAISSRIVAEAGGLLTVESRPGDGSTFSIRFPVGIDEIAYRQGDELARNRVLLLAPIGPAATALARTLKGLGAETYTVSNVADAQSILDVRTQFTGIIVDHRLDAEFVATLRHDPRLQGTRRVFLVSPESRPAQMSGTDYDGWLIRPLREQSLIDVLTGRLKGVEHRAAASEEFPRIAAEAESDIPADAEAAGIEGDRLSILVGEDDPVNAMISQAILEKAGNSVRLADSFSALEALLDSHHVDILLTDHRMPDGTCDLFIARLRDAEREHGVRPLPVIVLTADASDETRRMLLRAGADLVLAKPASPDMINGAIERVGERLVRAA